MYFFDNWYTKKKKVYILGKEKEKKGINSYRDR